MTLTWTHDNVFGHASTGAHPGRGLTDDGRLLVARMNELGVMVDVSHVSDRTALDAIEASRAPVLASHSGARSVGDHPRNIPDSLLRRIAEDHGAVCINYYAQFVDPVYGTARRALEREHRAEFDALPEGRSWTTSAARNALARRLGPELAAPTLRTLGEHFAHVARVVGPEGVCLGSDFDGIGELPRGMDDVSELPALRAALESTSAPRGGRSRRSTEGAGGTARRAHGMTDSHQIVVGRSRDCGLVISDRTVSGRHARLASVGTGRCCSVEDRAAPTARGQSANVITQMEIRPGDDLRLQGRLVSVGPPQHSTPAFCARARRATPSSA